MTAWTGEPADRGRPSRPATARNLGVALAKLEHQRAQQAVLAARTAAKAAKAELLTARADRFGGRTTFRDVLAAHARYTNARRAVRAAVAAAEARRASIDIARLASRGHASTLPLAQVLAAHDSVTARWLAYETDAAKLIAFPAMSDVRHPPTAVFVRQQRITVDLRPAGPEARITAEQFLAYRDAVSALESAFVAAEQAAWQLAREEDARREVAARERRAEEARARHVQARDAAEAAARETRDAAERARAESEGARHPSAPVSDTRPVWPVPGRTRATPPPT